MGLKDVFAPVVDVVFPPRCPLCGARIGGQTGLCGPCWSTLVIPGEPACAACSRPFPDAVAHGAICAPCLAQPPRHDGIAAATLYNEASRQLVLTLKHGNRIALAPLLAELMLGKLATVDQDWLIVPVPLHRWRLWRRGYNQSAELARAIARRTGARLLVDGLVRTRPTPSLGGLGKAARQRVMKGVISFAPRHAEALRGARVLLVDDVMTSGATSGACVSVLKRAGVKSVVISCFARVLDEALGAT